jgi:hypothetical protein
MMTCTPSLDHTNITNKHLSKVDHVACRPIAGLWEAVQTARYSLFDGTHCLGKHTAASFLC